MIQEVITLIVFVAFAAWFLKERMAWNHLASFGCLAAAAYFAFGFKS